MFASVKDNAATPSRDFGGFDDMSKVTRSQRDNQPAAAPTPSLELDL
jgi:hypothetical protein